MKEWLQPHTIKLVCDIVHTELDRTRLALQMSTADVTPDFITTWDINSVLYSPPPVLADSVRTPQIRAESIRSPHGVRTDCTDQVSFLKRKLS
jgi:hypothetical protein